MDNTVNIHERISSSSSPVSHNSDSTTTSGSVSHAAAAFLLNMDEGESSRLIEGKYTRQRRKRKSLELCFLLVFIVVGLGVGLIFGFAISYGLRNVDQRSSSGTYKKAAVAADAAICSTAGKDILEKGGSAVDGAIATILCVGVANLHSTGIGGGGFMIFYNATTKQAHAIDFREKAPLNASTYMFNNTAQNASLYGIPLWNSNP